MLAAIGAWEAAETRRHAKAILAGGTPHPHDGQKAAEAWLVMDLWTFNDFE